MASKPSNLWNVIYEQETDWAESGGTLAASGTALQLTSEPTLNLVQESVSPGHVKARLADGSADIPGPQTGSTFSIQMALTGHGADPVDGALTATDLYDLLALCTGGGTSSNVGGVVGAVTSANNFAVTGDSFALGSIFRLGERADGRGNGQMYACLSAAGNMIPHTSPNVEPNTDDQVSASLMVYPDESGASTVASMRFLVMSANKQYYLRGCYCQSIEVSGFGVGEVMQVSITFGVSRWDFADETFPSALTPDAKESVLNAGGQLQIQDFGVVAFTSYCYRNLSITVNMGVQALMGPCGLSDYQTTVGAVRTASGANLEVTLDAEEAGTETWSGKFLAATLHHVMLTCSSVGGRAVGFYFPKCKLKNRFIDSNGDGLNRATLQFEAIGTDGSTELDQSSWRLAMG